MITAILGRPALILFAGGVAMTIALGARHTFGLYLQSMTANLGWARQTFAFALAVQNLVYGLAQPFFGMLADKYGAGRVMLLGALASVLGLVLMADTTTGLDLTICAGLLIGTAVSCVSFATVLGAAARAVPAEKRSVALGIAGAAGPFGQFVMLPITPTGDSQSSSPRDEGGQAQPPIGGRFHPGDPGHQRRA